MLFFIWVRHSLENKGNRKRKQTLCKEGKWGSFGSPDIHIGSPSESLSPSIHHFHSSLTMKLLGRKGRLIQYCTNMKCFMDIKSRGSLKAFWSYSPSIYSTAWYPTSRWGSLHPKFLPLEQPHFIHELTNTLTSTSKVKLNIEAILAGSCYFLLSHILIICLIFISVLTEQAMFGFKLQRSEGRQRAHST